jgi:hypothetical protein
MKAGRPTKKKLGKIRSVALNVDDDEKCLKIAAESGASLAEVVRRRVALSFKRKGTT